MSPKHHSSRLCPICKGYYKDPVTVTCKGSHRFCFTCILKWVEKQGHLENTCPLCRGGDNFLILGPDKPANDFSYYSLEHFLLAKPILQKFINERERKNSSLVSERLLLTYLLNERQIELAFTSEMNDEDLVELINWIKPPGRDPCSICSYRSRYFSDLNIRRDLDVITRRDLDTTRLDSQVTRPRLTLPNGEIVIPRPPSVPPPVPPSRPIEEDDDPGPSVI